MKQRLFTIAAGVSLMLAVGVVAAWVDSYRHTPHIYGNREYAYGSLTRLDTHSLEIYRGTFVVGGFRRDQPLRLPADTTRSYLLILNEGVSWNPVPMRLYLVGYDRWQKGADQDWKLAIHGSVLLALFLVLPVWWTIGAWRWYRRAKFGHCRSCGYDLRGSAAACPECGEAVSFETQGIVRPGD